MGTTPNGVWQATAAEASEVAIAAAAANTRAENWAFMRYLQGTWGVRLLRTGSLTDMQLFIESPPEWALLAFATSSPDACKTSPHGWHHWMCTAGIFIEAGRRRISYGAPACTQMKEPGNPNGAALLPVLFLAQDHAGIKQVERSSP